MTTTNASGSHAHDLTPIDNALSALDAKINAQAAAITTLTARVAVLEKVPNSTPLPPAARRFALPTITKTVTAPLTGLQAFVDGQPNGTIIGFTPSATYVLDTAIRLNGRSNLIFEGNGATLKTSGWDILDSAFHFGKSGGGASHITVRNFKIVGDNPDGATANAYHGANGAPGGGESASGLQVTNGPSYIEVAGCTISDQWGHGIYVSSGATTNAKPAFIWLHDNAILRTGVMGIAVGTGTDIWIENNTITDTAIYPIDLEDGQSGEPMVRVYIGHNTINRWGWNSWYTGHAIIGDGSTGMLWDAVTVDANVMTGGFQSPPQNGKGGLISFAGSDTKQRLAITNNAGPANNGTTVTIANAPGAVVTGNTP